MLLFAREEEEEEEGVCDVVDLEMAQPVTVDDKLAQRVKEQQKREKLRDDRRRWRSDGLHDDGRVG